ncbi:MAG: hypothetical protein LBH22_02460 [Bacteroidales bacterium]|jgi:hypothetical protein|nr:hypothetical protein [Bacteroidales bacterium]
MKTILSLIVLTVALSFNGSAQQPIQNLRYDFTPEERMQMQVRMTQQQTREMATRLGLDKEQEQAIGEINLKYTLLRIQIMELAQTEEVLDIRALMDELEEKREKEILPFLEEHQMEVYYVVKEEQQKRRQQMQQQRGEQRQRGDGQRRQRE